jgi:hypothetical protein
MFALDERTSTYLAVGVPVGQYRSLLPLAFRWAASACKGAAIRFDGFDSSVIEIPKQSLQTFKWELLKVFRQS